MSPRRCRRPDRHEDDRLCFCPDDRTDVRKVLAQKFINGWVPEPWYQRAARLAEDEGASQEQLEALLFEIEDVANSCYGMWRDTQ